MREITTSSLKKIEAKKKKRNQLILGIILVLIMLFSTLGYSFIGKNEQHSEEQSNLINYNGFEFANQNGYWILDNGNFKFVFKYNPKEIEKLNYSSYEIKKANYYSNKPLYIFSESFEAEQEISTNLYPFVQRMQHACLNSSSFKEKCDENLPVKSCENNFIIISSENSSSSTNILQNKSCVFINGPFENLTKITDEFLFNVLGIK